MNKSNYDEAKRSAIYHVRQAKYEYERSIATNMKEDNKIFWKFIQSKTKSKENIPCIMDENGELQTDNKIKAELLNKFFQSVFTIEDTTQGIAIFPPRTDQKLETIEFDIQKVQEHLEKLKETKSSGPDQMHPKFLKETAKKIAEPLTKIFQKSIEPRKIPNTWKLANVTPIHKKGPKQQVTNYRPISLTSIICKSMEKFVKDSLMNHMESKQLFTNDQRGFRKGRSCITQLIAVMED